MLERLSGSINEVVTEVHLYSPQKKYSFAVRTKVFFKELTADEIEYYVSKYQPYDKAGAYGIQEWIGMIRSEERRVGKECNARLGGRHNGKKVKKSVGRRTCDR